LWSRSVRLQQAYARQATLATAFEQGFATSAAQAGASAFKIRAQTGHASDAMLGRYIRDGEIFVGNAAGALL
jgi:hypothetical protein